MTKNRDSDKLGFISTSAAAMALALLAQTDTAMGGATGRLVEAAKKIAPQLADFDVTGMIAAKSGPVVDGPGGDKSDGDKDSNEGEDKDGTEGHGSHASHASHASHHSSGET